MADNNTPARASDSLQARKSVGRAARRIVPRRALGPWDPETREESALSIAVAQSQDRLPSLASLRHARMATSPWHYYRGAAAVMAADLATSPNTGLTCRSAGTHTS